MEFSYKFYNTTTLAWEGMSQAILSAKTSVYWEIFAFIDDVAGNPFIDLLCTKARAGLDVKLVIDSFGSFYLSQKAVTRLKDSGAKVLFFNKLRPGFSLRNWWRRIWHRTHRKILIIDKEIAFIGGVNIVASSAKWQDLHLKLTGKIVRPLLFTFARAYIRAGGSKKEVQELLHSKLIPNLNNFKEKIKLILHSPLRATTKSPFKDFYKQALGNAKKNFTLLTPYYVPDKHFLDLIRKAHDRGVRINIVTPWKTDEPIIRYLAGMLFGVSAKAGAVFYFLRQMNHGKAVIVDDTLGMVGSANLTPRSFYINHEVSVTFSDKKMVDELNQIFTELKKDAVVLPDLGLGHAIGWYRKFKDWWMSKLRDYV
jgi:cardiolipin synthase